MATSDGRSFDDRATFRRMCRTFPGRTALFTVGPVLFGTLQLLNGYLHDASLPLAGVLFCLTVCFAVQVTRLHVASFRVSRLTGRLDDAGDGRR